MALNQTTARQILDLKVDSFRTGLEEIGNSFWVDDNQFVMTTLQEGAQRAFRVEDTPSRVALINFATQTVKYIAHDAQLLDCTFDHETRSIFIGKVHTTTTPVTQEKRTFGTYDYENLREIRIERDGRVVEIRKHPPGSTPRTPMERPKKRGLECKALDHGRGGYLVSDLRPGDTREALNAPDSMTDEGWPTIWLRPGKPDMPLPIRYDEIDSSGTYIAFLHKYLLNDYDTAVAPWTNSHTSTSVWKRPYEYTPFRLLGQDGSIEEIKYPDFVFDYGIAERGQKGANFGRFLVTRPGIVIQKKRESGSALYLYRNDKLYRVAGGKANLHMDMTGSSAEGVETTRLSPDGCKLAYSHLENLAATNGYRPPHFFSIIDLCASTKG